MYLLLCAQSFFHSFRFSFTASFFFLTWSAILISFIYLFLLAHSRFSLISFLYCLGRMSPLSTLLVLLQESELVNLTRLSSLFFLLFYFCCWSFYLPAFVSVIPFGVKHVLIILPVGFPRKILISKGFIEVRNDMLVVPIQRTFQLSLLQQIVMIYCFIFKVPVCTEISRFHNHSSVITSSSL